MLTARNLHKEFVTSHGTVVAIGDISFDVTEKAFVSIVGPSGAGKTTLLRCLAGLEKPTSGIVTLNDETITEPPRDLAVVFQDYTRSLLPWFSVQRNVAFPLNGLLPKSEVDERVNEAIEAVGLSNAKDRLPWQLSGGMQQRAAIARAIAYRPKILLMDEPFASVDAQTRIDLEDLTLSIQRQYDMTVLFVTHDIDEAVYLSDEVIVLSASPSSVSEIVPIPLPRDRNQYDTKEKPIYFELRNKILHLVRGAKVTAP